MRRKQYFIFLILLMPVFLGSAAFGAGQQSPLPTWPQRFTIYSGEKVELAFAVTQPGPIEVAVDWSGTALTMVIRDPAGKPVMPANTQSGPTAKLTYTVTPEDVQKGAIWTVYMAARMLSKSSASTEPAVSGKIIVTAPSADAKLVEDQAKAESSLKLTWAKGRLQSFRQRQPDPEARAKELNQARLDCIASAEADLKEQMKASAEDSGAVSSGGGPAVSKLSSTKVESGYPVVIYGSGLKKPCEVHFIINPGQDKVARVDETVSTATRILAYVPAASGIKDSYDGQVYVKCGQQSSDKIPFTFVPAMVYATLDISKTGVATMSRNSGKLIAPLGNRPIAAADAVAAGMEDCWGFDGSMISAKHIGGKFLGNRGEDEYFQSYTLKNNWVVESINFGVIGDTREASARIIEGKKGTTSPYVKIGWSNTPIYDAVQYVISYTIKGPEGVPFK